MLFKSDKDSFKRLKEVWGKRKLTLPLTKNLNLTLVKERVGILWKKKF